MRFDLHVLSVCVCGQIATNTFLSGKGLRTTRNNLHRCDKEHTMTLQCDKLTVFMYRKEAERERVRETVYWFK